MNRKPSSATTMAAAVLGVALAAGGLSSGSATAQASSLPQGTMAQKASAKSAPGNPVTGIPLPCAPQHPWPTGATAAQASSQLGSTWGIKLVGPGWTDPANASLVRIVWETLDGLGCTSYLSTIKQANPNFTINASPISGWAWGDWGLTRPGAVTVDFVKWQTAYAAGDKGRLVRLLVHEMGHAWSQTPQAQGTYNRFGAAFAKYGRFSSYGGSNVNESFSEVVGYYVARCAANNPYDPATNVGGKYDVYYQLVRDEVFGGHEFGTAPGTAQNCSLAPRMVAKKAAAAPVVTRVLKENFDSAVPRP